MLQYVGIKQLESNSQKKPAEINTQTHELPYTVIGNYICSVYII